MSLIDLYVKDKTNGKIHKVGTDRHDALWVDENGGVHYMNLQNGDGADGGGDNLEDGYCFVPITEKLSEKGK